MTKVRWGVMGTAKIAREKVIPAMQKGSFCEIVAIASRNMEQAKNTAASLNISKAYGSYESLLDDKEIDAVYIPLPNHLHVEWTKKCIAAGKHVLCEKPIGLSSAQARELSDTAKQYPHIKVMEAFMYRYHPQWQTVKQLVSDKSIGKMKMIQSFFSYYNADRNNIRNKKEVGGGGLLDIGCYCVSFARFLFDDEPGRVLGLVELDPDSHTDRVTTGILDFSNGSSTFTCSTQLMPYQRVNIIGTDGRIEVEIPVNTPPDQPARIWLHLKSGSKEIMFDAVDQYTLEGDTFSKAILDGQPVPVGLEDAVNNMKVIEAIFKSAAENSWIGL